MNKNFINTIDDIFLKLTNNLPQLILLFFLLIQFFSWFFITSNIKPNFIITPLPPSEKEMNFFSLGDKELLYRFYSFKLQNAGDTFGETIPLKDYDYEKLEKWFYALDELNNISEYVPSIAGFYYSASQNAMDNKYIVDYLLNFADRNPEKYWRWYITSIYLAKHKLHDEELVLEISKKILSVNTEMPYINKVLALFYLKNADLKTCKSVQIVKTLIESGDLEKILSDKLFSAKDGKYNFLFNLVKKKIDLILEDKKLIRECINTQ